MSSTFQQRLARRRQATMMKRGSPAPPPKITTSPKATVPLGAMSPPQEMRVKLLPRIAEYRAKGYISPKQEAQLHEKLSSRPKQFGETSDAIALEVSTALDQAKKRQQRGQTTTSATASSATNVVVKPATNSRSLFRKQPPANTDLTLANKLSYRRKSAMMDLSVDASSQPDDDDDDKTIDTKDLSVFAKKTSLTSPTKRPTTPVRQKKEILARARARRETKTPKAKSAVSEKTAPSITSSAEKARKRFLSSSSQQPSSQESSVAAAKYKADAQKYNAAMTAATTTSTTSSVPRKEVVSMARSIYAKQAAKEHPLLKAQSARSIYGNQSNKQLDRPSVLSSSTRSLDAVPSKEQELPVLKAGPATTGNARSIYNKVVSKPAATKEKPSSPTTKNASGNFRSVYAKAQKTQQASPTSISSRKLQSSIHAAKIQTAAAEEAPTRPASPRRSQSSIQAKIQEAKEGPTSPAFRKSQSSIYAKLERMQEMTERLAAASPVRSRVVSERDPTDPLSSPSSKDPRLESARSIYAKVQKKKALKERPDASDDREQENLPGQTVHKPLHIKTDIVTSQTQGVLRESPRSPNRSRKQQIFEPRQMWQDGSISSQEEIRDLFVEMAFFARLGFVQPPSCLRCVYRESIENQTPDMDCKRFVPWRKNANTEIHPNRLDDNIVLVQCRAARTLVQGKQVEHYQWDGIRRRLVNR